MFFWASTINRQKFYCCLTHTHFCCNRMMTNSKFAHGLIIFLKLVANGCNFWNFPERSCLSVDSPLSLILILPRFWRSDRQSESPRWIAYSDGFSWSPTWMDSMDMLPGYRALWMAFSEKIQRRLSPMASWMNYLNGMLPAF